MGDKKHKRRQMERLAEIANELEEREFAISREAKYLEELKAELDERERRIVAAGAALTSRERPLLDGEENKPAGRETPVQAASAPQSEAVPVTPLPQPSAKIVAEINGILKSVFWDYSNSVHHISTQISTVTAAMMCAAVTSILENRGFDVKAVFAQEVEKVLREGGLDQAAVMPHSPGGRPGKKPAPVPASAPEPERPAAVKAASKPAPVPVAAPMPVPVAVSAHATPDPGDGGDDESDLFTPAPRALESLAHTQDDVLRINSVIEFQKLGDYGFRNNDNIVRVQLPEGIQYLPGNFFYGCSNLREIWLPNSLLEIGANSFYGCKALETVHIGEHSALREIGEYAFSLCESLVSFTVPAKVETLGTSVFRFCASLEKLDFAKSGRLRVIGSHLLQNCTSLQKVRLPDSIKVIPTSMCYGCSRLQSVIAKGVNTIEDYAFFGNESLRTVTIGAKKIIAPQAFQGCDPALAIEYLND